MQLQESHPNAKYIFKKAVKYSFSAIREFKYWYMASGLSHSSAMVFLLVFILRALFICMKHTIVIKNNIEFKNRMWTSEKASPSSNTKEIQKLPLIRLPHRLSHGFLPLPSSSKFQTRFQLPFPLEVPSNSFQTLTALPETLHFFMFLLQNSQNTAIFLY